GAETMTAAVAEIAASLNGFFMDMSFVIIALFRSFHRRRRPDRSGASAALTTCLNRLGSP
ncbi:hypothetical protein, partial [Streptomyces cinerochromogenes]|uniref:hypothetical protein n=1 Tax=Streptomyces cinerochromogenes TaxID=66422 RepID=UPI0033AB3228